MSSLSSVTKTSSVLEKTSRRFRVNLGVKAYNCLGQAGVLLQLELPIYTVYMPIYANGGIYVWSIKEACVSPFIKATVVKMMYQEISYTSK